MSFPVEPLTIIRDEHYGITKYSELADEYSCSIEQVCICLQSREGKTVLSEDNYSIAYNDTKNDNRIRFTLMHEIGHIFLNHLIDFEKTEILRDGKLQSGMSQQEYKVLENEANAFARNVLSPVSMFLTLKNKSIENTSYVFGISLPAAETRIDFIGRDMEIMKVLNLSRKIMLVYHRFMKKRKCHICNGQFFIKYEYCPICGNKNTLEWGDGDKMKYPLLETYETGQVKECPVCENEDTETDGCYCQICGTFLTNHCVSTEREDSYCDNTTLPSNARYCSKCGSMSSFFRDGILKAWNYNESEDKSPFMTIPDVIDERLPFYDEDLPFN